MPRKGYKSITIKEKLYEEMLGFIHAIDTYRSVAEFTESAIKSKMEQLERFIKK